MDISMGSESEADTRATDEGKIEDLCVFQFESDTKGKSTAKLIGRSYVHNSGDGTTVSVALVPDVQSFLYVCANVGNVTADFLEDSSTYQNMLDASLSISGQNPFSTSLPMSGCSEVFKIENTTDGVAIALTRMVAKVTFNCNLSELPNGDAFEITGAKLCNVPQTAKYVSEEKTSTVEVYSYESTGVVNTATKTTTYTWYMPENKRGDNTAATSWTERIEKNAPTYSTYIELTGNYTPSGGVVYGATYVIYLGNGKSYTNYDVVRNHHYIITSTIKGINLTDLRVTTDTNLSADGLANCYLAGEDNHWYRFNGTIRGNGNAKDYAQEMYGLTMLPADGVNIASTSISDAVVIWETAEGLIKSVEWDKPSGCVKFQTGTAKGNALIAVRNAKKEVLWSWHIWRTNGVNLATLNTKHTLDIQTNTNRPFYTSLPGVGAAAGRVRTLTILDRNIGAAFSDGTTTMNDNVGEYNLHYQFGRKDPFPGGYLNGTALTLYGYRDGKTTFTISGKRQGYRASAADALKYTILNPEVILTGNSDVNTTSNWINAALNSDDWKISNCLWGDENKINVPGDATIFTYFHADPDPWDGEKTIYDPSPAGWRVIPADTWTGITKGDSYTWARVYIPNFYLSGDWMNGWWVYFNDNLNMKTFLAASGAFMHNTGTLYNIGRLGSLWFSSPAGQNNLGASYFVFELDYNSIGVVTMTGRAFAFPVRCARYSVGK